jgi:hypothetical protein
MRRPGLREAVTRWLGAGTGAVSYGQADREGCDPDHAAQEQCIAIASYLGAGDRFDRALSTFAEVYADQNERDHRALADAVAAGRVTAGM